MGTRGFVGFVIDGTEKIAYNQFDSYPSGLGATVLSWLSTAVSDMDALRASVRELRVVEDGSTPTPEDIERLRGFANQNVSTQRLDEWYVLLRETQGQPELMLKAGVIEDASNFPTDSLFAEYGYIVDLDAGSLEAYRGFQRSGHTKGRFADRPRADTGYAPVALAASWPLNELPTEKDFVQAIDPDEEDDE
jgi:hypothetical protein